MVEHVAVPRAKPEARMSGIVTSKEARKEVPVGKAGYTSIR